MITVAMIDDDPVARIGFADIVANESEIELISSSPSVESFEAKAETPTVVVLNLGLRGGGASGWAAVAQLVAAGHRVLVFTISDKEGPVLDALEAKAMGYLTKEAEPAEIVRAIKSVADERLFISATVAGYLLVSLPKLTPREREVLTLAASGETSREIAHRLYIDEKTVNGTLDRIRDKTGLRRRTQLTKYAIDRGLL
ncbi:DNA-binding NarL/FixJ family response regulator [Kribbella aluminosa]|uniref:DNA-binding NarL/FixJ family response regulator n=1 Tax=Kribbella aluminosa TaxID=416017 RepID=A0ABS4UJR7_9ACTN|nr:response regulator transcription factor [Kribbella aluminosa]MBP2351791.1 DNA-binding NarL/FixJ family response regulator [Kribbella aluminosa]